MTLHSDANPPNHEPRESSVSANAIIDVVNLHERHCTWRQELDYTACTCSPSFLVRHGEEQWHFKDEECPPDLSPR